MVSSCLAPSESQPTSAAGEVRLWEGRLFGAFRLTSPDGADATPTSRKARALVAYLLAATDDGTSRERLAGLLWSERGDDQARASLRQAFYDLRKLTSGNAPPLLIDRTRVALVAARVTTDGARLEEAARADDATTLAALVGHHPAEFLADLDGVDPAFDDWLSGERTRRRDARRRVLLAVAERRLAASDADAAQQLADSLLASDPSDEAAARIAMEASHRRGDRDAVRRQFASLVDALHRQVGVRPSDETDQAYRRSMTTPRTAVVPLPVVPSSSDAPVDPPVTEHVDPPAPSSPAALSDVEEPTIVATDSSWARRPRRWTLIAAAVALLAVAAGEMVGWRHAGTASLQRVLLVEPMQVAPGDPAAAALRIGFSAELARVLVGWPTFVVRDAEHEPNDAPERTFVVAADTQTQGGVLHVGLRLLARKDGPTLWSTTLTGPVGDVAALREQMATKIADVATCALDGRHTDLRTFRPETLQLLLGACGLRHTDAPAAARLLEQLTREMPDFSHGWAMLAVAADDDDPTPDASAGPSRTESYARRAIDLDPHEGEAYLGRAYTLSGIARWPQRMAILHEGLNKDPDNAALANSVAYELSLIGQVRQAIGWSERAVQADPFNPLIATEHANLLAMGGIPFGPEAAASFAAARRRFGSDPELAVADFRYYALFGDYRRATEMLADPDRSARFQPTRGALWKALIATRAEPSPAHDAEAERAFVANMRAIPDVNPWTLEELSVLNRVDDAYAYAERMPARPEPGKMETLFGVADRPLRADPRFMTLAARLGIVAVWRQTGQWPDFCSDPTLGYDCKVEAQRALSPDARPLIAKP